MGVAEAGTHGMYVPTYVPCMMGVRVVYTYGCVCLPLCYMCVHDARMYMHMNALHALVYTTACTFTVNALCVYATHAYYPSGSGCDGSSGDVLLDVTHHHYLTHSHVDHAYMQVRDM
jgi:hypothetical protein